MSVDGESFRLLPPHNGANTLTEIRRDFFPGLENILGYGSRQWHRVTDPSMRRSIAQQFRGDATVTLCHVLPFAVELTPAAIAH